MHRIFCVFFTLVCFLHATIAAAADVSGQRTLGHAHFTVITPNLVRIEYAPDDHFTDAPTLFAANRSARDTSATITQQSNHLQIQTAALALDYADNGKPLDSNNLQIHLRDSIASWVPGQVDHQNLGGTLRTLDQCAGPVDLGNGLISRSGWAVVDDSKKPILTTDWVASRPNQQETDWYFLGYGHDYLAALKSLAAVSGSVPMPRKNLLGVWYSRYWPYTSDDYRQIVREYTEHDFPLDNIVMDMDWHITDLPGVQRGYANMIWTGYTWNRKLLPDAEALLKWFHQQGLFVTLNDHPADGVQPHEQMYADFMRAMGADPASHETIPFDAGSKKYLDTFWQYTHVPHQQEGVDFWWLDWQQYPFTRSVADLPNLAWLNQYYFQQTSADGKRGVSFSRWAGWGDQRHPIHFSGDAHTDWPMLAFEVPFTSTAGNVGCFFWSHDIGGHMGGRNEESYTRWCQFGALSAALRSHSTRNAEMDRRPWKYPKWAEDSMRISFHLRSQLFPYIYSSAAQTCQQMLPLLRPMYLAHPDQEPAYHNAQEYYFGDNLLVAPIVTPGTGPNRTAWQAVWIPNGSGAWYDYFTGERYEAGTKSIVACDTNSFPLLVRGGAPIPMQPYSARPATAPLSTLIVRAYPGEPGSSTTATLYEDDGQTRAYEQGASALTQLTYSRTPDQVTIAIAPTQGVYAGQLASRAYRIELPAMAPASSATVDGQSCQTQYDATSATITVDVPARPIDQSTTIAINAQPIDPRQLHQRALAQRLSGLTGQIIEPGDEKSMLAKALASNSDPHLATAIFAAAGVTIMPLNDAPYLYGGKQTYTAFLGGDPLDSNDASLSLISTNGSAGRAAQIQLSDGAAINIDRWTSSLTDADAVVVPGLSPSLQSNLRLGGRSIACQIPTPGLSRADTDLARSATAAASSATKESPASGAIDGVADGYPSSRRNEWSSDGEKAGATLTLTWRTDQTISRIDLYDRPNPDDQVTAGQIEFSDGSSVNFGELPNDGRSPAIVKFSPRAVRWLRVKITAVSPTTKNTGLAEVAVFK